METTYLDAIREWMETCDSHHSCNHVSDETQSTSKYPSRVIDTWDECVVENNPSAGLRYLALSYRWKSDDPDSHDQGKEKNKPGSGGQQQQHSELDRTNLASIQKPGSLHPSVSTLPKVIRDAMHLTKTIGERYLWVDRLCIVQHDPSTVGEIICMDHIYSGAHVTLIAAASGGMYAAATTTTTTSNAATGRSKTREEEDEEIISTVTPPPPATEISVYSYQDLMSNLYSRISETEWSTRGWTYQEHILCRRAVFFLDHAAFWECEAGLWAPVAVPPFHPDQRKSGPKNGDDDDDDDDASCLNQWRPSVLPSFVGKEQGRDEYDCCIPSKVIGSRVGGPDVWWPDFVRYMELVCPYNGRELTVGSDGLAAFSGILNRLAPSFPGGFVGGLPALFLDHALLWQPLTKATRRANPEWAAAVPTPSPPELLPSWSWCGWQCYVDPASLNSGTKYSTSEKASSGRWKTQNLVTWSQMSRRRNDGQGGGDGQQQQQQQQQQQPVLGPLKLRDHEAREISMGKEEGKRRSDGWLLKEEKKKRPEGSSSESPVSFHFTHEKDRNVSFKQPLPLADDDDDSPLGEKSRNGVSLESPYLTCQTSNGFFRPVAFLQPTTTTPRQGKREEATTRAEEAVVVVHQVESAFTVTQLGTRHHPVLVKPPEEVEDMPSVVVLQGATSRLFAGVMRLMTDDDEQYLADGGGPVGEEERMMELVAISKGSAPRSELLSIYEECALRLGKYEWRDEYGGFKKMAYFAPRRAAVGRERGGGGGSGTRTEIGFEQYEFEYEEDWDRWEDCLREMMIPDGAFWGGGGGGDDDDDDDEDEEDAECHFYNVLWIERGKGNTGVAHRRGCGRIPVDVWEKNVQGEIKLVLG